MTSNYTFPARAAKEVPGSISNPFRKRRTIFHSRKKTARRERPRGGGMFSPKSAQLGITGKPGMQSARLRKREEKDQEWL